MATALSMTHAAVRSELKSIKLQGAYNLERSKNHWFISPVPKRSAVGAKFTYKSSKDNIYKFGFIGDTHLCSKYERLDVLNELYDIFSCEGVDRVFHQGNWVEGESRFNRTEIHTHGLDPQLEYFAANYPVVDGITTYAVTGDDHEGWWAKDKGIDIGVHLENIMRKNGRTDWVNTGYAEAFIPLVNANSGKTVHLLSMHPGGGSAYATSYKPQKIVESFSGGEKPSVLLIGHYHKLSYNIIRNVHTIQTGCTQDQTTFMRKKGIDAHIGGGICALKQNPKCGSIYSCQVEFFYYFNKGKTNNRWSHSGSVELPSRGVG